MAAVLFVAKIIAFRYGAVLQKNIGIIVGVTSFVSRYLESCSCFLLMFSPIVCFCQCPFHTLFCHRPQLFGYKIKPP